MSGPWPWTKFRKALASADVTNKQPAVVLASGAFSLMHRGHVDMMHKAKERLERAGYAVLGGWLSLWGEGAALEKAAWNDHPKLGTTLRLRVAELTVENDDFVSIGTYEIDEQVDAAQQSAVAPALASAIQMEFGSQLGQKEVQVFIVCGTDEIKELLQQQSHHRGRVVVPRGEDSYLEKPNQMIFEAEAAEGKVAALSGTKLRKALEGRDMAFVNSAMAPAAVQLVFGGTTGDFEIDADLAEFLGEGELPPEPWPSTQLMNALSATPEDSNLAVLVMTGSMGPAHKGHVQMLRSAKDRMERAGYAVIASYMLPYCDAAAAREAQERGPPEFSVGFRTHIATLSCCDDPLISVVSWEVAGLPKWAESAPKEIVMSLRNNLLERFPLSLQGRTLRAFFVCGTDVAKKHAKFSMSDPDLGMIVVPREDGSDEVFLEEARRLFYMADAVEGLDALSSTQVRAAIKAGEVGKAGQWMTPAAARFTLAPTPSERQKFKDDFEKLGAPVYKEEELAQARERLKGTLRSWIGPAGTIQVEDLERLLKILDPSWTSQEFGALMSNATKVNDGNCVVSDDFIDWVFSQCKA